MISNTRYYGENEAVEMEIIMVKNSLNEVAINVANSSANGGESVAIDIANKIKCTLLDMPNAGKMSKDINSESGQNIAINIARTDYKMSTVLNIPKTRDKSKDKKVNET